MNIPRLASALALGAWAGVSAKTRRARRISLKDRVVLIAGGSRGLGLELARAFGDRGARVALVARDKAELDRAATQLRGQGVEALIIPCDVSDTDQVEDAVEEVVRQLGGVDVLVNSAGVVQVGPIKHMRLQDFQEAMDVHFYGPLITTLAARPHLAAHGRGRIVNITSIGGRVPFPHLLPYTASKFAAVGLSEGLRVELDKEGILVTTVVPGLMRTGSPPKASFKGQHDKEYGWFAVSESLPLVSSSAARAARRIVRACEAGTAEIYITPQAKVAAIGQAAFPGLMASALSVVDSFLPAPRADNEPSAQRGEQTDSAWAPSFLTVLSDVAAARNNELDGETAREPPGRR